MPILVILLPILLIVLFVQVPKSPDDDSLLTARCGKVPIRVLVTGKSNSPEPFVENGQQNYRYKIAASRKSGDGWRKAESFEVNSLTHMQLDKGMEIELFYDDENNYVDFRKTGRDEVQQPTSKVRKLLG